MNRKYAKRLWFLAFLATPFYCALPQLAFSQTALPWQGGSTQPSSSPQDSSLHSVSGMPLFIDGTQTKTKPALLAPALLTQVKNVTTLGDALKILGPAYTAPDDKLHIAHWNFTNGAMLTLWPQGGEALTDTVNVAPRPDCGVPTEQCDDFVLYRKQAGTRQHKRGSGSGSSGSGGGSSGGGGSPMSLLSPLMKMMPGR